MDRKLKKHLSDGIIYQIVTKSISVLKIIMSGIFLTPEQLGIFSILQIYVFFLESISKTGVTEFLIATDEVYNPSEWDNAWTIDLIKYIFLGLICFVTKNLVANFFNIPILEYYLNFFTIIFILNGLRNNKILLLQKQLRIRKYLIYNAIPNIISLFTLYIFYINGFKLLSLIYSQIILTASLLILSFLMSDQKKVSIYLDRKLSKEQLRFGKWIFFQTILDVITEKIDKILIGKFIGISELGNYSFSSSFTNDLLFQGRNLFRTIFFPFFSNIKYELNIIRNKYIKLTNTIVYLGSIIYLFIFHFYSVLIHKLFGTKWDGTIIFVKVLSIVLLINLIVVSSESLFLGIKKPLFYNKITVWKLVIYLPLVVLLGFKYGIIGILVSLLVSSLFSLYLWIKSLLLLGIFTLVDIKTLLSPFIFLGFWIIVFIGLSGIGYINSYEKLVLILLAFVSFEYYQCKNYEFSIIRIIKNTFIKK